VTWPAALASFDESVLRAAFGSPAWAVPIFYVATVVGAGWGYFALVPLFVRRSTRALAGWLVAATLAAGLVTAILKAVVQRVRPCNALGWCHPIDIARPDGPSFPSGHATGAFAFAAFVTVVWPRAAPIVIPCALLVAWSRCVLGVHYPTDVLAGAVVGTIVGVAFAREAMRRRKAPDPKKEARRAGET
jgi:undecaprenyl-diphosphatase